jgi:CheY-like chemotaxis protein
MTGSRTFSILIADDDELVRGVLTIVAEELSDEVVVVEGGAAALAKLETRRFDVLITDLRMPGVDGLELTRFVTREHPHTRVIVVTGFATPESERAVRKLGAELIQKPFGARLLRERIQSALEAAASFRQREL